MLAATTFKTGARYEDFDKKTDKVAEYGLMGLILGGAGLGGAKVVKVGLLAACFKFLIAGWQVRRRVLRRARSPASRRFFTGKRRQSPTQTETKLPPPGTDGNT